MANIIKGIKFLFGREKSCMEEDINEGLRFIWWIIFVLLGFIICIALIYLYFI